MDGKSGKVSFKLLIIIWGCSLGISSLILSLLLINEASNNKLLEELQNQDKTYLDKAIKQNEIIIKQNEDIIERLKQNVRHTKSE